MSSGERPELVLTYANEAGTAWVTNLVLSLRSVGVDHSLIVTPSAAHCSALFSSPARLSCGHTSWEVPAMQAKELWERFFVHDYPRVNDQAPGCTAEARGRFVHGSPHG